MKTSPRMELDQLVIKIPGRKAGNPLSLQVFPGQTWGILGPNGSGKTTLLLTLAGLKKPQQGQIHLAGQALESWSARERACQLALVFQQQEDSFPASVLETTLTSRHPHLKAWQRETPEDSLLAQQALERMDLAAMEERCITTLSGGERQRLALACLLTQQTPLWLLDEPTNHLDLHHQISALELINEKVKAGGSAIMALHDLNLASRFCSHLLLLYPDGQACWGPKDQMLELPALERLYQQPLIATSISGQKVFIPQTSTG
ncbi:iron complex transport system ATP-binding protein [Marinospirillum celere]|uniref:Iron complex transport system ATP-binding protein n=1 Tax=Marinospirillum celere TaxID=1122252 RepID=A0A1I1ERW3_9GAMM|nr:ABC transporter ATP-binding protein [Marinospirillum celere]SFB89865.1 iron complex transport system ATP-binding protein [Marinospirillum celere]